jgi:hypothetical protein
LAQGNDAVLKVQLNGTNAGTNTIGLAIQAANSTIKGLVINRFDGAGILISGSTARGNNVVGNFIGTNAAGTADLGNTGSGVVLLRADNTVGGRTRAAARNVISGNGNQGVEINGFTATGNEVLGNYIGTDKNGTADLGNSVHGVSIFAAADNTVGGTASGARNVISGNTGDGVSIGAATGNEVLGNFVGTNAAGTAGLGNTNNGVRNSATFDTTVGGMASGAGNRIAHNGEDGVLVDGSGARNRVLSNQIFSNTGLGIDLNIDGVTANDIDDPDTGPNNLQNFPVISGVIDATTVAGTLNSNPNQSFTVQCFLAGEAADASGHGEGAIFLSQDTSVTTNASGDAGFECVLDEGLNTREKVSATATNTATGDTSEFSRTVTLDL